MSKYNTENIAIRIIASITVAAFLTTTLLQDLAYARHDSAMRAVNTVETRTAAALLRDSIPEGAFLRGTILRELKRVSQIKPPARSSPADNAGGQEQTAGEEELSNVFPELPELAAGDDSGAERIRKRVSVNIAKLVEEILMREKEDISFEDLVKEVVKRSPGLPDKWLNNPPPWLINYIKKCLEIWSTDEGEKDSFKSVNNFFGDLHCLCWRIHPERITERLSSIFASMHLLGRHLDDKEKRASCWELAALIRLKKWVPYVQAVIKKFERENNAQAIDNYSAFERACLNPELPDFCRDWFDNRAMGYAPNFQEELCTIKDRLNVAASEFGRLLNPEHPYLEHSVRNWLYGAMLPPEEIMARAREVNKHESARQLKEIRQRYGWSPETAAGNLSPGQHISASDIVEMERETKPIPDAVMISVHRPIVRKTEASQQAFAQGDTFGSRLIIAMAEEGMTVKELAECMETSPLRIYSWEKRKEVPPKPKAIKQLAEILHQEVCYFITGMSEEVLFGSQILKMRSDEYEKITGLRIKVLRYKEGLTRAELTERMHVSERTVGWSEEGMQVPHHATKQKFADAFDRTISYIFGDISATERRAALKITKSIGPQPGTPNSQSNSRSSPATVLVMCKQNRERSPLARAVLNDNMPEDLRGRIGIYSRGIYDPVIDPAFDAIAQHDPILSSHKQFKATREEIAEAAVIFVMTADEEEGLVRQYPEARDKVSRILQDRDLVPYRDEQPGQAKIFVAPREPYWRLKDMVRKHLPDIFDRIRTKLAESNEAKPDKTDDNTSRSSPAQIRKKGGDGGLWIVDGGGGKAAQSIIQNPLSIILSDVFLDTPRSSPAAGNTEIYRINKTDWLVNNNGKRQHFKTSSLRADKDRVDVQIFTGEELAGGYSYLPGKDELYMLFVMPDYIETGAVKALLADMRYRVFDGSGEEEFDDGRFRGTLAQYETVLGLGVGTEVYDMQLAAQEDTISTRLVNDTAQEVAEYSKHRGTRTDI